MDGGGDCVGVKGEHWKAPEKKARIKKWQRLAEVFIEITESIDWRIQMRNCGVLKPAPFRNVCGSSSKRFRYCVFKYF